MKLLYISNARMPTEKAHGIQIVKMCEAFAQVAEVELVVPRRLNKIKANLLDYYNVFKDPKIKKNFKIIWLPCLDLIPWDKYFGYFALWLESLTFSISVFFYMLYMLFKKVDIIYTRDKSLLFLSCFRKNLVFEAHTFPKRYFLYSFSLKRIKKIVVITRKLEELFIKKGIEENKILVVPDGVDLGQFDIGYSRENWREERFPKHNIPLDKKIVLYAGHLYDWKGATTLLKVADRCPNLQFVFVGGTEKDVADFKKRSGNMTNVSIIGYYPYRTIPYWLKAADVLVLPNSAENDISKYWTSPLKMFEYMASKRPIVASDLPSIKEILNEENSVLVKPDDPEELAGGINMILENQNLADRISQKAFEDVQSYTWQKRVEKILNSLK